MKNSTFKNIPNALSLLRIVGAATLAFLPPLGAIFFAVYALCVISDVADGIIARRTNNVTKLGALLDSIGDTVFTAALIYVFVPILPLSVAEIVWIAATAAVRAASLITGYVRFHAFAPLHTYANKAAGAAICCFPILFAAGINSAVFIPCVIAFIASMEELLINILSVKLNRDIPHIFALKK